MIAARTSADFCKQGLTIYADDNLGSWLIHDLPSLHRSLREAAVILDVLSECGFEVSAEKSIFLLELRGSKASQALKQVTCMLADGKGKGVRAGRWVLPLKTSHPYLGVILSFRNFEMLTYQHRREKASTVLRDQQAMHVKERVRLWKALVLKGLIAKHIRVIGRCHSYYTRETNDQVLDKLAITPPQQILLREAEQCITQSEQLSHLQPSRVLEWQQVTKAVLQQQATSDTDASSSTRLIEVTNLVVETFDCPACGQEFGDLACMHKHWAKAHKISLRSDWQTHVSTDYTALSWQGMPTCVFCRHQFWGWPEFNLHVAYLQCPGLRTHRAEHGDQYHQIPPQESDHKPLLLDPEIRTRLETGTWFHIIRLPRVREALANHCPICHKYMLQSGYIKGHIRSKHPHVADLLSHCEQRVRALSTSRPCVWCGKDFKRWDAHFVIV